ncbi:MAG: two-component system response regulator [Phototrophicales bacterium]|nr:MAG: two-component system response regulator [Phototrophicales bacterium]
MVRVLVVEDNRDNMMLIQDLLMVLRYEVITALNGIEGVEKATSELPDLILMDLSLPEMDGWTATKTIKANPITAHIPILALTAHAMVGDREKAIDAGCDDYISKPINIVELRTKLALYLPNV